MAGFVGMRPAHHSNRNIANPEQPHNRERDRLQQLDWHQSAALVVVLTMLDRLQLIDRGEPDRGHERPKNERTASITLAC